MKRLPGVVIAAGSVGLTLFALPTIALAARASWSEVGSHLAGSAARSAAGISLVVSVAAVGIALVLGTPLALLLARGRFPGRAVVRALVLVPVVMPPVVGGVALLNAFGRNGILGRPLDVLGIGLPFTTAGTIVAVSFVSVPLFVLAVETGLRAADPRLEGAAATLGVGPLRTLARVTMPSIRRSILAGGLLCFARALGEFGATITFAGNLRGRTQTLPLAVFESLQSDPEAAISLSLLLIAIAVVLLVVGWREARR